MKLIGKLSAAALVVGLTLAGAVAAYAHKAPTGWNYDTSCCSTSDCRQVSAPQKVTETKNGFVVPSGELIPFGSKKIRMSRDEFFHWCTQRGEDKSPVICLYVPNRGY